MPTIGALSLGPPVPPRKTASPKAKTPPSAATSQYPRPVAVPAIPTTGRFSRRPPVEPKKPADPKAKTPPSDAASHVPPSAAVGATGAPDTGSATAGPVAIATGIVAARARRAENQRRSRREPRMVVPDTLRVALAAVKPADAGSTLLP